MDFADAFSDANGFIGYQRSPVRTRRDLPVVPVFHSRVIISIVRFFAGKYVERLITSISRDSRLAISGIM